MARKKLKRFADNEKMAHVIEPSREEALAGLALKGQWGSKLFNNENPIFLELGCGKGEYTIALAKRFPNKNFIGVDIKGSRIWYGAKAAEEGQLQNVAFLRTQIELLDYCFASEEVSEIWITFPDPQIKHARLKHRLTHPDFLNRYAKILRKDGLVHLKTDSEFLHGYTVGVLQMMGQTIIKSYYDIDKQLPLYREPNHLLHEVKTHYESLFRSKGKKITYLKFKLEI
jgi:tRNA (guanine-N7-)-methyltransferase